MKIIIEIDWDVESCHKEDMEGEEYPLTLIEYAKRCSTYEEVSSEVQRLFDAFLELSNLKINLKK